MQASDPDVILVVEGSPRLHQQARPGRNAIATRVPQNPQFANNSVESDHVIATQPTLCVSAPTPSIPFNVSNGPTQHLHTCALSTLRRLLLPAVGICTAVCITICARECGSDLDPCVHRDIWMDSGRRQLAEHILAYVCL